MAYSQKVPYDFGDAASCALQRVATQMIRVCHRVSMLAWVHAATVLVVCMLYLVTQIQKERFIVRMHENSPPIYYGQDTAK